MCQICNNRQVKACRQLKCLHTLTQIYKTVAPPSAPIARVIAYLAISRIIFQVDLDITINF